MPQRAEPKTTTITTGRRAKRLPPELEAIYWRLSEERRKNVGLSIAREASYAEAEARRQELAAKGTPRRVSFVITSEQHALLERIGWHESRYPPGAVAGELFDWAFPLLKTLADRKGDVGWCRASRLLLSAGADASSLLPSLGHKGFRLLRAGAHKRLHLK